MLSMILEGNSEILFRMQNIFLENHRNLQRNWFSALLIIFMISISNKRHSNRSPGRPYMSILVRPWQDLAKILEKSQLRSFQDTAKNCKMSW